MVKKFKGQVKIADVQAAFDEVVGKLNAFIDYYNETLKIVNIDFSVAGTNIGTSRQALTVGAMKKFLEALDGTLIGCEVIKVYEDADLEEGRSQFFATDGLFFSKDQITPIRSQTFGGKGTNLAVSRISSLLSLEENTDAATLPSWVYDYGTPLEYVTGDGVLNVGGSGFPQLVFEGAPDCIFTGLISDEYRFGREYQKNYPIDAPYGQGKISGNGYNFRILYDDNRFGYFYTGPVTFENWVFWFKTFREQGLNTLGVGVDYTLLVNDNPTKMTLTAGSGTQQISKVVTSRAEGEFWSASFRGWRWGGGKLVRKGTSIPMKDANGNGFMLDLVTKEADYGDYRPSMGYESYLGDWIPGPELPGSKERPAVDITGKRIIGHVNQNRRGVFLRSTKTIIEPPEGWSAYTIPRVTRTMPQTTGYIASNEIGDKEGYMHASTIGFFATNGTDDLRYDERLDGYLVSNYKYSGWRACRPFSQVYVPKGVPSKSRITVNECDIVIQQSELVVEQGKGD